MKIMWFSPFVCLISTWSKNMITVHLCLKVLQRRKQFDPWSESRYHLLWLYSLPFILFIEIISVNRFTKIHFTLYFQEVISCSSEPYTKDCLDYCSLALVLLIFHIKDWFIFIILKIVLVYKCYLFLQLQFFVPTRFKIVLLFLSDF